MQTITSRYEVPILRCGERWTTSPIIGPSPSSVLPALVSRSTRNVRKHDWHDWCTMFRTEPWLQVELEGLPRSTTTIRPLSRINTAPIPSFPLPEMPVWLMGCLGSLFLRSGGARTRGRASYSKVIDTRTQTSSDTKVARHY